MPLLLSALTSTPGLPGAGERDYPSTLADAARQWAAAVGAYAAGIAPPTTALAAAESALEAQLATAFAAPHPGSLSQVEAAFTAFAAALALGMAPAFVGTPPPGPVGFATLTGAPQTRAEGTLAVATLIDTWFRTGLAAPVLPPSTPIPWS